MIDLTSLTPLLHDIGSAAHNAGPDKGWWPEFAGGIFGSYRDWMQDAVKHKIEEQHQEEPHHKKDMVDERMKSLL